MITDPTSCVFFAGHRGIELGHPFREHRPGGAELLSRFGKDEVKRLKGKSPWDLGIWGFCWFIGFFVIDVCQKMFIKPVMALNPESTM